MSILYTDDDDRIIRQERRSIPPFEWHEDKHARAVEWLKLLACAVGGLALICLVVILFWSL